ncbi:MAG: hypothetical protein PUF71_04900 [Firmicutes bacterium]|nr:hypothetical protein [Bacillota bacterium]
MQEINGKKIDLNKVIRMNQNRTRRGGGYYYLMRELGISVDKAKEILDPVYDAHEGEKVTFWNAFGAQAGLEADKQKFDAENRKRMDAAGQIYCPKCSSTSISANQKGFSFARGAVGAMAGLDVGLIAGGIGSKKIVCTCLKCGYQWKPGKK